MTSRKVWITSSGQTFAISNKPLQLAVWSGVRRAIIKAKRSSGKPFRSIERVQKAAEPPQLAEVGFRLYLPKIP